MNSRELKDEMRRMDDLVRHANQKFRKGAATARGGEAVEWRSPLDELIALEEQAAADLAGEVDDEGAQRVAWELFRNYEDALMEWLFAAGPHPLEVMRRLFAYTKMKRASLLLNMGFRQVGPLLKETHAAAQLRCRALFGDTPAGWKKPAESVERMRRAARGNCNRRGGKKISQH